MQFAQIRILQLLGAGHALVELSDGSSRDILVALDNRVLYLVGEHGTEKLDTEALTRIEFLR